MGPQRSLESFAVGQVKDERLPLDIPGFPLSRERLLDILTHCPAILTDPREDIESLPFNDAEPDLATGKVSFELHQPSTAHCRSFDLRLPELEKPWTDEYCNRYSALSLKGNNFGNPGLMDHPTAAEGLIAYGLQESNIIERVLRASKELRARGIPTEHIVGLAEPKQLPWPIVDSKTDATELIPPAEYKRRVIDAYWRGLPEQQRTTEALLSLHAKFRDTVYYVSLRATDTAYRLHDMKMPAARRAVFDLVNAQYLEPGQHPYQAEKPQDFFRYLTEFVAPRLGRDFARLHTNLAHRFAHGGNLTGLGSFVDLDSIHGEALGLGDDPIDNEDRILDIQQVVDALKTAAPEIRLGDPDVSAAVAFFTSYIDTMREQAGHTPESLEHIARLIDGIVLPDEDELYNYWAPAMQQVRQYFVSETAGFTAADREGYRAFVRTVTDHVMAEEIVTSKIFSELESDAEKLADLIVNDYINELNDHYVQGQKANAFDLFMQDKNKYRNNMFVSKQRELYVTYSEAIISYASHLVHKSSKLMTTMFGETTRKLIWHHIADQTDDYIDNAVTSRLEQYLESRKEKLRELAGYEIPEPLLPNNVAYLHTGNLSPKSFWLQTDGVPLKDVRQRLEDLGQQVVPGSLIVSELNQATLFVSEPQAKLLEIISDSYMDGSHETTLDDPLITIEYEDRPKYVLVVELLPDGSRKYRLLQDKSKAGPDLPESGEMTSEFSAEQLTLFGIGKAVAAAVIH